MKCVVLVIALISMIVGIGFSVIGAWLVLPFAGIEVLAIAYAFYFINCHSHDYESIVIEGDDLAIEKRDYKTISRTVLNRHWAKVVLRDLPSGDQALFIRSHGKEIGFGKRFLNNEQRLALAKQLKKRVGDVY